ncbi:MAG: hypothetical protein AAGM67_13340, partial [Bacteroidota bacterium]
MNREKKATQEQKYCCQPKGFNHGFISGCNKSSKSDDSCILTVSTIGLLFLLPDFLTQLYQDSICVLGMKKTDLL